MQERLESQVGFLSQEDPLEEKMATHSRILAGKSHGQGPCPWDWGGYSPWGPKELTVTEFFSIFQILNTHTHTHTHTHTYT